MTEYKNHEAFQALKGSLEEQVDSWKQRQGQLIDLFENVSVEIRKLIDSQQSIGEELGTWPQLVEHQLDSVIASAQGEGEGALVAQQEALASELAQVREQETQCRNELQSTLEQLETLRGESDAAFATIETLQQERDEAHAQVATLQEEFNALQEQLQTLQDRFGRQQGELAQVKDTEAMLRQESEATQQRLEELEAALRESIPKSEADALRALAESESDRANTLQEQMEQENAYGLKSALATQLADALRDSEHAREELRQLKMSVRETGESQTPWQEAPHQSATVSIDNTASSLDDNADIETASSPSGIDDLDAESLQFEEDIEPETRHYEANTIEEDFDEDFTLPVIEEISSEDWDWERKIRDFMKSTQSHKRSMGEILEQAEVITSEQLLEALDAQRSTPQRHLGEILVEMGMTTPEAIALVLALQSEVDYVRLHEMTLEPEATALISERLAQLHTCIPIHATEDSLTLAISNPMDLVAIEDVERASNRKVEVLVATAQDVREAIAKHYWEPE